MIRTTLAIFIITVGFSSCYYDVESELYPGEFCNVPEEVSYSESIQPIISNSCATTGCHIQGGVAPGILDNYDQVKDVVDAGSFGQRVLVDKDMPPSAPLGSCDLLIIEKWIAQGAPNN